MDGWINVTIARKIDMTRWLRKIQKYFWYKICLTLFQEIFEQGSSQYTYICDFFFFLIVFMKPILQSTHTVWSNMIVLKVFNHKTLKIEFIGSIFDLNSTQVWAILCKCVILKKNSLLNPNSVASKESYKSEKLEIIGIFRCYRMSEMICVSNF